MTANNITHSMTTDGLTVSISVAVSADDLKQHFSEKALDGVDDNSVYQLLDGDLLPDMSQLLWSVRQAVFQNLSRQVAQALEAEILQKEKIGQS